MSTTNESGIPSARPGPVRRFWWRSHQRARLTIACLGVLTTLAVTGAAGVAGSTAPARHRGTGLDAIVHRDDSLEVTVRTVSEVDLFEGVEPATGLSFHARVSGVRRIDGCWLAESRNTAQNLLRGRNVRLVVRDDASGSDRFAVDVRLPDGSDYARTVVGEGAAAADLTSREELAPLESAARQDHRGLWATGCATGAATATGSSAPSPSAPATTTTTTTPRSATAEPSAPPSSEPATSTSSPPPADEWVDNRVGKPCLLEGMRRTSPSGNEIVCARNRKNELRWRRAE